MVETIGYYHSTTYSNMPPVVYGCQTFTCYAAPVSEKPRKNHGPQGNAEWEKHKPKRGRRK